MVIVIAIAGWVLTCGAWRLEQEVARTGPLETRSFDALTVVTLGTGGAYENPDRRGPATAVASGSQIALVDAGRAVADALRLATIPVGQPDWVLLSSLLPENTLGLDDLLLTGWINGRERPLRVIGPVGTRALTEHLLAAYAPAIASRRGGLGIASAAPEFEVSEVGEGWSEELGDLSVRAAALNGGPTPALAYRFEAAGRSAVIGGTGWAPEALVELARGADLLVHEAVFVPTPEMAAEMGWEPKAGSLEREAAEHTSIDAVGGLAALSGVDTLVLVRMRPPPVYDLQITSVVGDAYDGRIVIAVDGDEIRP
jgi:ribonuclease BN (tRNA processing enzyme)